MHVAKGDIYRDVSCNKKIIMLSKWFLFLKSIQQVSTKNADKLLQLLQNFEEITGVTEFASNHRLHSFLFYSKSKMKAIFSFNYGEVLLFMYLVMHFLKDYAHGNTCVNLHFENSSTKRVPSNQRNIISLSLSKCKNYFYKAQWTNSWFVKNWK